MRLLLALAAFVGTIGICTLVGVALFWIGVLRGPWSH